MKATVNERTILLPGGKNVDFEYPVKEIAEFEDVIVVVLGVPAANLGASQFLRGSP